MTDQSENKWKKMAQKSDTEEVLAEKALLQEIDDSLSERDDDEKLDWLKEELVKAQESAQKEADRLMRTLAEMDNLRRRTDRDIENARKYAVEKLLKALLPAMDSMDRGLQVMIGDDPTVVGAREGLIMTREMTLSVLQQHGIVLIDPKEGDTFNPTLHEAVSMQAQEGLESNAVVNALQPGYELNGRVIRAAMVTVTP